MLLAFYNYALQFLKDWKLFVGGINLSVALLFTKQKTHLFQLFEFALNITGVFFNELSESANVGVEVGIFSIDDNDFTSYTAGNKNV